MFGLSKDKSYLEKVMGHISRLYERLFEIVAEEYASNFYAERVNLTCKLDVNGNAIFNAVLSLRRKQGAEDVSNDKYYFVVPIVTEYNGVRVDHGCEVLSVRRLPEGPDLESSVFYYPNTETCPAKTKPVELPRESDFDEVTSRAFTSLGLKVKLGLIPIMQAADDDFEVKFYVRNFALAGASLRHVIWFYRSQVKATIQNVRLRLKFPPRAEVIHEPQATAPEGQPLLYSNWRIFTRLRSDSNFNVVGYFCLYRYISEVVVTVIVLVSSAIIGVVLTFWGEQLVRLKWKNIGWWVSTTVLTILLMSSIGCLTKFLRRILK